MLELAIDLEGFTVGEGQDLHHDDARDPHYRVDPVIDSSTIHGMTAAMTNTGFVALPILHSIYGQPAVPPAAIATVFVAGVMFPATVILLGKRGPRRARGGAPVVLVKQIVLNPMVLSTLIGLA
jgi:malonate transporter and related proteins